MIFGNPDGVRRFPGIVLFSAVELRGRTTTGTRNLVNLLSHFNAEFMLMSVGCVVRFAPNHLSFSDHSAQKVIYGFGTVAHNVEQDQ